MKIASHKILCIDGTHKVDLWIANMSAAEAIDVYLLPADLYAHGGYRIEAAVNGIPAGTLFFRDSLGSEYYGHETDDVARTFLAFARQKGILPRLPYGAYP